LQKRRELQEINDKTKFLTYLSNTRGEKWKNYMKKSLKLAIHYYFCFVERFASVNADVVNRVMHNFNLVGHNCLVQSVLTQILYCESKELIYGEYIDVLAKKRGRKSLIIDYTMEAEIIYNAFETGLSAAQATALLNFYRQNLLHPMPKVSKSADSLSRDGHGKYFSNLPRCAVLVVE
jgi:type IV secretory pathway VirB4 component